jgi:hypothetical protein
VFGGRSIRSNGVGLGWWWGVSGEGDGRRLRMLDKFAEAQRATWRVTAGCHLAVTSAGHARPGLASAMTWADLAVDDTRESAPSSLWTESKSGKLSPSQRDLRHTLGRPLTVV